MNLLLELLEHSLEDTWMMLPLLYIAYLVIETFERKPSNDDSMFFSLQKYGPAFGALLGLLPQCGFSVLGAMLFSQHFISAGTLLALFIATSDEAIPVMISEPEMIPSLALLLVCKFVIAVVCGYLADRLIMRHQDIINLNDIPEEQEEEDEEEMSQDEQQSMQGCSCCYPQYPIWKSALFRTLKIWLFAFAVTFVLTAIIHFVTEETLSQFLLAGSWIQPVLAALFGFIPNCAITVALCQLYASHALSFASLLAGLVSNAGMGLLVLFQYGEDRKTTWKITLLLFASALIAGYGALVISQLLF